MSRLMQFPRAVKRDPAIDAWMREHADDLGAIAQRWFRVMRACGDDVREILHDDHPTACVADAAFGYVNAFTAHVNVGFFLGAELADPDHLLEGTGKFMRHVKLRPDRHVDAVALTKLIETAYADMKSRLENNSVELPKKTVSSKRAKALLKPVAKGKGGARAKSAGNGDWRAETLAEVRRLILEADPEIVEERKWIKPTNPAGVPVWSHDGIVCTGEMYKDVVKLTFFKGASLPDPQRLFNASLDGNARRAIDLREGEALDAKAFKTLIRAAVEENLRSKAPKAKSPAKRSN